MPTLLIVLAAQMTLGAARSSAAASAVPDVEPRGASSVGQTSATIEVAINPEGGETSYEIWLECQSAAQMKGSCEPLTVSSQRQQGVIAAGTEAQIVTDAVSGLQPGYLYAYGVIASNSAGKEGYINNGFLTCPSVGACPSQPWLVGEALWVIEGARRAAEETPRLEAEEKAKQRENEERPVKEAAERAAWEREIREAGERAGREAAERDEAAAAKLRCHVPRLGGDSLALARRALAKAHCDLGKVTRPRSHHGVLVVGSQSVRTGRELARGAKVAVTLRPKRG